jgi:hypothetical protein
MSWLASVSKHRRKITATFPRIAHDALTLMLAFTMLAPLQE